MKEKKSINDKGQTFISELDTSFYRSFYPELKLHTENKTIKHWITTGIYEGRFPNKSSYITFNKIKGTDEKIAKTKKKS